VIRVVFQTHVARGAVNDAAVVLGLTILEETAGDDDDGFLRVQVACEPGSPRTKRTKSDSFIEIVGPQKSARNGARSGSPKTRKEEKRGQIY
jgi:hypothetical protein